jgi:hypothetical protein
MTIIPLGKHKKRVNVLKDKPDDMSLTEWIAIKEQQRKDKVIKRLDGLTYERDPESPE